MSVLDTNTDEVVSGIGVSTVSALCVTVVVNTSSSTKVDEIMDDNACGLLGIGGVIAKSSVVLSTVKSVVITSGEDIEGNSSIVENSKSLVEVISISTKLSV